MADYVSQYSGEEIDARLAKVTVNESNISLLNTSVNSLGNAVNNLDNSKVEKVPGKGLSTNDYTDNDKAKLGALPTGSELNAALGGKVDKVPGKGLSTNDYTTTEKNKLDALPTNADLQAALLSKQDVIADLSDIRSGAAAGATAYQKPGSGIPSTDLDSDVAETLEEVDNKSDKDTDAVEGNLASFDGSGNPVDSGISRMDFYNVRDNGIAEGIADTISAGTPQEFVFRKSGGDGVNYMKRIKGKTLAWNQLVHNGNFADGINNWSVGANISVSVANNKCVITATQAGLYEDASSIIQYISVLSGHKYYISADCACDVVGITPAIDAGGMFQSVYFDHWGHLSIIKQAANSLVNTAFLFKAYGEKAIGDLWTYSNIKVVDLTLLYGSAIGGMTDEQILAKYESDFGTGYHDSNPGELISNDAKALETVGFNLWDEEWESGTLSGVDGIDIDGEFVTTRIRSKNFIPCLPTTEYYAYTSGTYSAFVRLFWYDINKNFIAVESSAGAHTSPNNAAYFRFTTEGTDYGGVYNHDICINLSDPAKNGTYEPHKRVVLPLNLADLEVISPNIWDEEWEDGDIEYGENHENNSRFRSKNYIPVISESTYFFHSGVNTRYEIFFYDGNKNYISLIDVYNEATFVIPSGICYMRFFGSGAYPPPYNHDICINESNPGWNGNYYPHGTFKPFPDGMRGAGTAFDYARRNKVDSVMRDIDLGEPTWSVDSGAFLCDAPFASNNNICICSKYAISNSTSIAEQEDKTIRISIDGTKKILVKDSSYSDAATFKAAMSGVMLYYEQANYEEFDLVTPLHNAILVDLDGTERAIYPESTTPSAPFACDSNYSISIQRLLAKLNSIE